MEATRSMLDAAIATLRAVAIEAVKVMADGAPAIDQKKSYNLTVRNATAHVVALAYKLSAGKDTIRKLIGDATIKATKDVLKVRLSEANKVRTLHADFDTLADLWMTGEANSFDQEAGGYSVAQALKDVAKPANPMGALVKAVIVALTAGETPKAVSGAVVQAVKEWQVEQAFLAGSEDVEEAQAA